MVHCGGVLIHYLKPQRGCRLESYVVKVLERVAAGFRAHPYYIAVIYIERDCGTSDPTVRRHVNLMDSGAYFDIRALSSE